MGLKVGDEAVCVVKATNVIVEVPSRQGVPRMSVDGSSLVDRRVVLRRLLAAPARRRRRPSAPAAAPPASERRPRRGAPGVELTIFGAASLKGALEQAKAAYEAANPGTTLTLSTDSSAALETQIEQGAPGRRLPVGRHDQPAEARRRRVRRGRRRRLRRQRADDHRADRQPGRDHDARGPRRSRTSRSSPPATRCRSRSTRPSSSTNLASEAGYPADFAAAYAANVASKEDNVKAVVAQDRARRGRRRRSST